MSLRNLSSRTALPSAAVLLVLLAGAAAYANRPVPYGDRVAVPGVSDARPVGSVSLAADGLELRIGSGLEAYDSRTGAHRWSYRREGATALHLVRSGGDAVVLWDDGLLTAVRPSDHQVRWHRAVPGLAAWLRGEGEEQADGEGADPQQARQRAAAVLQPVDGPEPWVGVLTPTLAMGFRDRDGDLRWTTRPPSDCLYDPVRAARTDSTVVVSRPCAGTDGDGRTLPGEVTGFQMEGRRWSVPTGPEARPVRLDARRVAVSDGPVLGVRVIDTPHGNPVPGCGSPEAPLAAEGPSEGCRAGKPAEGRPGGR